MAYNLDDMLLLLLSIKNTNSSIFVMEHLSFGSVGTLCAEALREGLIVETRKNLEITEQGLIFITQANKKLNRKGIDKSIAHIPDVYIQKISEDAVYLPEKI